MLNVKQQLTCQNVDDKFYEEKRTINAVAVFLFRSNPLFLLSSGSFQTVQFCFASDARILGYVRSSVSTGSFFSLLRCCCWAAGRGGRTYFFQEDPPPFTHHYMFAWGAFPNKSSKQRMQRTSGFRMNVKPTGIIVFFFFFF